MLVLVVLLLLFWFLFVLLLLLLLLLLFVLLLLLFLLLVFVLVLLLLLLFWLLLLLLFSFSQHNPSTQRKEYQRNHTDTSKIFILIIKHHATTNAQSRSATHNAYHINKTLSKHTGANTRITQQAAQRKVKHIKAMHITHQPSNTK